MHKLFQPQHVKIVDKLILIFLFFGLHSFTVIFLGIQIQDIGNVRSSQTNQGLGLIIVYPFYNIFIKVLYID